MKSGQHKCPFTKEIISSSFSLTHSESDPASTFLKCAKDGTSTERWASGCVINKYHFENICRSPLWVIDKNAFFAVIKPKNLLNKKVVSWSKIWNTFQSFTTFSVRIFLWRYYISYYRARYCPAISRNFFTTLRCAVLPTFAVFWQVSIQTCSRKWCLVRKR